jgi:DNA-binding beta-propeller fold protein YncE
MRMWCRGSFLLCSLVLGCSEPPSSSETAPLVMSPWATPVKLPTGVSITPTAAAGADFQPLNPDLPTRPQFVAGQAVTTAVSPDGNTLLILTSGYNRNNDATGKTVAAESNEYVFVYDITHNTPVKRQVLEVPNTFDGIAWGPGGDTFYVSGGVDDALHVYARGASGFAEAGTPIKLGHKAGLGLAVPATAAGVAVDKDGARALVANFENDSVSVIDLGARSVVAELDLRPGKNDPTQQGVAGGEYPFWITVVGNEKAYVSSQRDRQLVVLDLTQRPPRIVKRIAVGGQPNKMILDRAQRRLFVANGDGDSVSIVDTASDTVRETFPVVAPRALFANGDKLRGANPNALTLSPDERMLFVSDGGLNAVAVVRLGHHGDDDGEARSHVVGLIPTGWYPSSVSLSRDGQQLYIVNTKSPAGPNEGACRDSVAVTPTTCGGKNLYVWQLTKAGFLTLPVPSEWGLARLSWQVAENDHFPAVAQHPFDEWVMSFLRSRIKHVVYIVKENRTYDQVLGDLAHGDGDPALTIFPRNTTPNHHALAEGFVTLDRFFDSGEVSGDGWNWSVAARTSDQTEKTVAVNYAGRGLNYDWEGTNRNINVAYPDAAARIAANPLTPSDPDLLPGSVDTAAADRGDDAGAAYLWDAAVAAGLSVRNYGFFGDLTRYSIPQGQPGSVPLEHDPASKGLTVFWPAKASLLSISDPYYRGYDNAFPDTWREKEWEREFDAQVASDSFPSLSLVRFMHDHFGSFGSAIDGVNTPELQMADNDYAVGLLVDKIAHSRYADSTLVFVLEDDAQNGGDHVDAHRSVGFVVGAYVKQHVVVSTNYDTVNLVRTIEDVLGVSPIGLTDGLARPMSDLFHLGPHAAWNYNAVPSPLLRATTLPLPPAPPLSPLMARTTHDAAWWERAMAGQDFSHEDRLDEASFNRTLWRGLVGESVPYPTVRHGRDLSQDRVTLLRAREQ